MSWMLTTILAMTALTAESGCDGFMVRGLSKRKSDLKELFQLGVITSISSAAGCSVKSDIVDTGIDVSLSHEIAGLTDRRTINFQLKCTEQGSPEAKFIEVRVPKKRYDEYRYEGKTSLSFLLRS